MAFFWLINGGGIRPPRVQDPGILQVTAAIHTLILQYQGTCTATCPEMSGCQPKHHCLGVPGHCQKEPLKKNDGGNLGKLL